MNDILNDKKKVIPIVGYFFFFVPFLTKEKNDEQVEFHAFQALGLFLSFLVLSGVMSIVGSIFSLSSLLTVMVPRILFLVGAIFGALNVSRGQMRPLPYIGEYIIKLFA